jgi:hypothetical protein
VLIRLRNGMLPASVDPFFWRLASYFVLRVSLTHYLGTVAQLQEPAVQPSNACKL